MGEILFVSDIHLDSSHPNRTRVFEKFLNERAPSAEALYILGDLFEFWIGDDNPVDSKLMPILQAFDDLRQRHIKVYFMAGNRDFLLGKTFMNTYQWSALLDPTPITLNGRNALILHGDTLCTDDVAYQRFRRVVRCSALQWLVLHLPLRYRQQLAKQLRQTSSQATQTKPPEIMDVNLSTVIHTMQQYNVDLLIHGHTHRPGIHHCNHQGKHYTRIVLGDWHNTGSVLCVNDNGYTLEEFY